MNYETMLAASLSEDQEEKLAAHFDSYSADELADLLQKEAWSMSTEGHRLDAAKARAREKSEHAKAKAEDKYEREATGVKRLLRGVPGMDHLTSRDHAAYAARKHEAGKNAYNPWGGFFRGSDLMYTDPTVLDHNIFGEKIKKPKEKKSSVEIAESWGREMAYEKVAGAVLVKLAAFPAIGGMLASAGRAIIGGANKIAPSVVKGVNAFGAMNPGRAAMYGAGAHAAFSGARAMLNPKVDPYTGKRQSVIGAAAKGAVRGGLMAGGANLALGNANVGKMITKAQQGGGVLSGEMDPNTLSNVFKKAVPSASPGSVTPQVAATAAPAAQATPVPLGASAVPVPLGASASPGQMAGMEQQWQAGGLAPTEIANRRAATGRRAQRIQAASTAAMDPMQARAARMQQEAAGRGVSGIVNRYQAGPNAAMLGKTGAARISREIMEKNSQMAARDVGSFA